MNKWLLCLFAGLLSNAVQAKDYRIGLSVWSDYPESINGFKRALADKGFIEGKNVKYILKNAHSNNVKQQQIAHQFASLNLDLVYSLTTPGTVIVKQILAATVPIVFSIVTYPADAGLIESFEYSGNNLVGTSNFVPLRHYITLLDALLPNTQSIAIFHRKGEPNSKIQTTNLVRLLTRKGIKVHVRTPQTIAQVKTMGQALADKIDVFITTTDTLMQGGGEKALIEIAKSFKRPILSSNKQGIMQGSTFGAIADFYTLGKISGGMAAQILSGTIPAKLPSKYQQPPTLLINRQRAKDLNIRIPESLKGIIYVE